MLGRTLIPVQLAADHGELARPDPHRVAARPHLRVRQGAAGQEPQGRDQRAPREDRVPRVRARHHQAPAARPAIPRIPTTGRSATRWCSRTSCRSATATRIDSRYYAFQIRVPVDDTHTMHLWYTAYVPPKGAKVPRAPARQGPRLRRAVQGQERRVHSRQHRRPGHDGVDHARRRSPTAPRRTSAPPTTASRSIAACSAARSRRSRKASTRCSPSAIAARNVRIDLPNERKKHHNSDGMRSWIMRTHAAYSPIAEDVCRMYEAHKPRPAAAAGELAFDRHERRVENLRSRPACLAEQAGLARR